MAEGMVVRGDFRKIPSLVNGLDLGIGIHTGGTSPLAHRASYASMPDAFQSSSKESSEGRTAGRASVSRRSRSMMPVDDMLPLAMLASFLNSSQIDLRISGQVRATTGLGSPEQISLL